MREILGIEEASKEQDPDCERKKVKNLIEERRRLAKSKGTDKLIERIFNELKYLPFPAGNDLLQEMKRHIDVDARSEKSNESDVTILTLASGILGFRLCDRFSCEFFDSADLEICWNQETVMIISMSANAMIVDEEYLGLEPWRYGEIKGYIPGDWENSLKELEQTLNLIEERQQQKSEVENLESLKKRFGL